MRWVAIFCAVQLAWADVVVVQRVEQGAQCTRVTLRLKGTKIRADIGPEITLLMDTAAGSTVTLRHSQKTAQVVSAEAARQLLKQEAATPAPTPRATGQSAVFNGRAARAFSCGRVTWWVAERLPDDPLGQMVDALRKTAMVRLADGLPGVGGGENLPGVPLRTEFFAPDGTKITVTVLSAREKPLEAIDFEIPSGYRVLPSPVF